MKNKTKECFKQLVDKGFSVYTSGEFERKTDFIGLIQLLYFFSDFTNYEQKEQEIEVQKWIREKEIYIDANISLKINK